MKGLRRVLLMMLAMILVMSGNVFAGTNDT